MEYQTIYNKENTRIKFLAFVIIMPAYIDVLNVLLNTIGIGMTSVVTACIYIYVLISLILKCGIRKIDFFYLIGFYLVFLLNYVFFSSTRSEMLSQGMIIVYIFFIPYGLFSFKNVVNWDSFFSYLYKYAKWAIISGGMMLLFLPYDKYLGYMDYSYSLLPAVCAAYYYQAKGKNIEGKPWQIAIEKPTTTGERAVEAVIGLDNMGMASSGDYRIYFEENGKRFAHEIDPKTGYPIQHHLASITVLAPTSMTADGLSTGLFVLGEDKALEVAEKNNLAVYLIIKTDNGFVTKSSSAFKKLTETKE